MNNPSRKRDGFCSNAQTTVSRWRYKARLSPVLEDGSDERQELFGRPVAFHLVNLPRHPFNVCQVGSEVGVGIDWIDMVGTVIDAQDQQRAGISAPEILIDQLLFQVGPVPLRSKRRSGFLLQITDFAETVSRASSESRKGLPRASETDAFSSSAGVPIGGVLGPFIQVKLAPVPVRRSPLVADDTQTSFHPRRLQRRLRNGPTFSTGRTVLRGRSETVPTAGETKIVRAPVVESDAHVSSSPTVFSDFTSNHREARSLCRLKPTVSARVI